MNKEIFQNSESHLILFCFFFLAWKANKEKRKKDRDRYCNRSVRNINLLFNNSCSEFIHNINDYNDSCGKMDDDGIHEKHRANIIGKVIMEWRLMMMLRYLSGLAVGWKWLVRP